MRATAAAAWAAFDGGPIASDAGLPLLRRVDRRPSLFDRVADCFTDHRDPKRVQHSVRSLITQRILGIALGYEDLNDHNQLRHDPLMALFSEKGGGDSTPVDREAGGSQWLSLFQKDRRRAGGGCGRGVPIQGGVGNPQVSLRRPGVSHTSGRIHGPLYSQALESSSGPWAR